MGKLCTVSEKENQYLPQVLSDFEFKLQKGNDSQQGEETTYSFATAERPRSPLQAKPDTAAAATRLVDNWIRQKPEIWTRHFSLEETAANVKENSCSSRSFSKRLDDLETQSSRRVNSMQIKNSCQRQSEAQSEAKTAKKWKKLIPVIKLPLPCPPSTPKNNDCDTTPAFRRRKLRGDCPGSPFNERHGKRVESRRPETISVDNFKIDPSENELNLSQDSDEEDCDNVQVEEKKAEGDNVNAHVSGCLLQVNPGVTSTKEKKLNREQETCLAGLDSAMSRQGATVTVINQSQKRRLSPSPLDAFAQRPLERNVTVCSKNLELAENFAAQSSKEFDATKEMMINKWLVDVSIASNTRNIRSPSWAPGNI